MKVIFIYGPPAAGKLTISKELAKITDTKYSIFDEHLIIDVVLRFFSFKSVQFLKMYEKLKTLIFKELMKTKTDFIVTQCPSNHPIENNFWKNAFKEIENTGKLYLVRLECSEKELLKRVMHGDRKPFAKIRNTKILKDVLKKRKNIFFADYLGYNSYVINNTKLSAKQVARKIKQQYLL